MSAKLKSTVGQILTVVGYFFIEVPFVGYALIALGGALQVVAARQAKKAAEAAARRGLGGERARILANVRDSFSHHLMVFGKARVGGGVVTQRTHTPTPSDFPNQDLYIGVANSIAHPGGCEGIEDLWIDDTRITAAVLSADPSEGVAFVTTNVMEGRAVAANIDEPNPGGAGGSRFVIVGTASGGGAGTFVNVSDDGRTWRLYDCPLGIWNSITYGNDTWVAVGNSGAVMTSPDGEVWTSRTAASSSHWVDVVWAEDLGLFVAVASNGGTSGAMTSPDGETWTLRTTVNKPWVSIAWAPEIGYLAAVEGTGGSATNQIMVSTDGITWTGKNSPADKQWRAIAWNGLHFVAISKSAQPNNAMKSSLAPPYVDTWSGHEIPVAEWRDLCAGRVGSALGGLVAVGNTSTNIARVTAAEMNGSSSPGWVSTTAPADYAWSGIVYAGTTLGWCGCAEQVGDDDAIMTSTTALSWNAQVAFSGLYSNSASNGVAIRHHRGTAAQVADQTLVASGVDIDTDYRRGIAWTWGRFRRPVSDADFSEAYRFSVPTLSVELKGLRCYDPRKDSTEGGTDSNNHTWTTRTSTADVAWRSVTYSRDLALWCAVGGSGNIMTSPDGFTWTARTAPHSVAFTSVAWSHKLRLFVAVANTGTAQQRVASSPDGITWTARSSSARNWSAVVWSPENSLFAAVAYESSTGSAMTSPDGVTWTSRTTLTGTLWTALVWVSDLGLFVALGVDTFLSPYVMTSPDGVTWTRTALSGSDSFTALAWSPELGLLAAVNDAGGIKTSTDGLTWTTRTSPTASALRGICWNGVNFVAVGSGVGDPIVTSPDGITWTLRTTPALNDWWACAWNGLEPGLVVAVGQAGTGNRVMTSTARDPMRHNDPATWDWTDNPILHAVTYSIMETSDGGWGIPTDRIDWDSVISAANICDENKTTPVGTRKRFVGNGVLLTTDKNEVNLQKLLDACFGRRVKVGGVFKFYAAAYRSPTFTIDDTWLAGGVRVTATDPLEAKYNAVRVNYNDADKDYKTIDAPPYVDDLASDDTDIIWKDLSLPMVSNTYDAQYLAQILGKKSRYQMTVDLVLNRKGLDVEPFESGYIDLPGLELISSKVFRIEAWSRTSDGTVAVTLQEDHPDIYTVEEMQEPS